MDVQSKACSKCKKVLEINSINFSKHIKSKGGFRAACKICTKKSDKRRININFNEMANSSLHSSYEKFKAELILGNPQYLNIKAIVNSFGLDISNSKSSTKISCINELTKCFKEDAGLLNTTLDLFINKLKFNNGITGVELRGMFLFLKKIDFYKQQQEEANGCEIT